MFKLGCTLGQYSFSDGEIINSSIPTLPNQAPIRRTKLSIIPVRSLSCRLSTTTYVHDVDSTSLSLARDERHYSTMSAAATKLSPALKALISAPHARGSALPAPPKSVCTDLFTRISSSGRHHGLGLDSWLCLSTASLVTVNSPAALCELYDFATQKMTNGREKAGVAAVSAGSDAEELRLRAYYRCRSCVKRVLNASVFQE